MTIIVWREHYSEPTVEHLRKMGTLPRYETDVKIGEWMTGDDVATEIVEKAHADNHESFQDGGKLDILDPAEYSGTYDVIVSWEPTFSANKVEPE